MNDIISKATLEAMKAQYQPGARIEVINFNDPYVKILPGKRATVEFVDDIGTLHCAFDFGRHMGLLWNVDQYRKIAVIPSEIINSIKEIARSGATNMIDAKVVFQIAVRNGHGALADFIFAHTPQYSAFIISGNPDLE